MGVASVYILRKKMPNAVRPYRMWMYPYTLWLFVGVSDETALVGGWRMRFIAL
jgi:hypothetical protein